MELTVPILYLALNSKSLETAFTKSWQSSNTPSIAMLWMFSSIKLNICACWKGLMRPCGLVMKTRTPRLPRMAYSAALPVSPLVAPKILSSSPRRANSYSNKLPSNCMAMSLKAKVGPLDKASTSKPSPKGRNGTISFVPNTASV